MHISKQGIVVIPVAQDIVTFCRDHFRVSQKITDVSGRHAGGVEHGREGLPDHVRVEIFHITVPAEFPERPVKGADKDRVAPVISKVRAVITTGFMM